MKLTLYRAMSKLEYDTLLRYGFLATFKAKDKFFVDDPKYILDRIWLNKTFNGLTVKDNYNYLVKFEVEFINGFRPKVIKHFNYNVIILRKSQINVAYRVLSFKLVSILATRY